MFDTNYVHYFFVIIFFFREFYPMAFAPVDSSLSPNQDSNWFSVYAGIATCVCIIIML